jgi:large subunit ribosomal protein L32e
MSESKNKGSKLSKQEIGRLLELRKRIKARTPEFRRFESWRFVRIGDPWRKPKGIDNHMRLSVKGWPHLVKVGYRVPKQVRHLHPSGQRDVLVHNMFELESLSPSQDAARLAAGVGRRKRVELVRRAKELGIRVLNGRSLFVEQKENASKETDSKSQDKKKRDR